ncbi:hypothetical protein ACIBQ6_22765 [Nonomuraea sp. NPDC049655]|uniref:hypothetical protein n=1 Tax=Nonomuraea sp. NPDC049655 TaxID=3364355 RepID=UPI0037A056BF
MIVLVPSGQHALIVVLKPALVLRLGRERVRVVDDQFRHIEQTAVVVKGVVDRGEVAPVMQMPSEFAQAAEKSGLMTGTERAVVS